MSYWARCIVVILFLPLIFRCFFSALGGGLSSVYLGGTKIYVLMVFIIGLLSTISSKNGSSSESDEYKSLYPLEVRGGEVQLGIGRNEFFIEAGGIVESIIVFEMDGEWKCLAKI